MSSHGGYMSRLAPDSNWRRATRTCRQPPSMVPATGSMGFDSAQDSQQKAPRTKLLPRAFVPTARHYKTRSYTDRTESFAFGTLISVPRSFTGYHPVNNHNSVLIKSSTDCDCRAVRRIYQGGTNMRCASSSSSNCGRCSDRQATVPA